MILLLWLTLISYTGDAHAALSKNLDAACEHKFASARMSKYAGDLRKMRDQYLYVCQNGRDYPNNLIEASFRIGQLYERGASDANGVIVAQDKNEALKYYAIASSTEPVTDDSENVFGQRDWTLYCHTRATLQRGAMLINLRSVKKEDQSETISCFLRARRIYREQAGQRTKDFLREDMSRAEIVLGIFCAHNEDTANNRDEARESFTFVYHNSTDPSSKAQASAYLCRLLLNDLQTAPYKKIPTLIAQTKRYVEDFEANIKKCSAECSEAVNLHMQITLFCLKNALCAVFEKYISQVPLIKRSQKFITNLFTSIEEIQIDDADYSERATSRQQALKGMLDGTQNNRGAPDARPSGKDELESGIDTVAPQMIDTEKRQLWLVQLKQDYEQAKSSFLKKQNDYRWSITTDLAYQIIEADPFLAQDMRSEIDELNKKLQESTRLDPSSSSPSSSTGPAPRIINDHFNLLARVPKDMASRIEAALQELAADYQTAGKAEKMHALDNTWRIRVGDWRILYTILSEQNEIGIIGIDNRNNVYKEHELAAYKNREHYYVQREDSASSSSSSTH